MDSAARILAVLDRCLETNTFTMLDNGYVYPAASRLSLFRSDADWALVIETFGYNHRSACSEPWSRRSRADSTIEMNPVVT